MTVSITQLLAFHADKGTPDDYCPSVNLGELKTLIADRDRLQHIVALHYLEERPLVNPGNLDPPLPEDYPVHQYGGRRAPPGWQFGFIDDAMLDKFRLADDSRPALTTSRTPAGILPSSTPLVDDDNAEPFVRTALGFFALVILFALFLRIVTGTP